MSLSDEIIKPTKAWLTFIDSPGLRTEDDLLQLEQILDALASSRHALGQVETIVGEDGDDPPDWSEQAELRKRISDQFPMLGFYNVPRKVTTDLSNTTTMLGDAIDDLLDITNELRQVEWLTVQGRLGDASWHFAFGFDHHWRYHVRGLQWYLEMRRFESA